MGRGRASRLDCAVVVVAGAAALLSVGLGMGLGSIGWVDRPPSLVVSLLKSSTLHFGREPLARALGAIFAAC